MVGYHWIKVLDCKRRRLTRDEIAASDNLLFFHPSAIVASFSDIWRLDLFGAIRKVTSLFSRICSGIEKSKEDRRRNLKQKGYGKGRRQEEMKTQIGSLLIK